MPVILIAGSRHATPAMLEYARRVVQRVHELNSIVVVGDNPRGVDMAVVQECDLLKVKVLVVGITNSPRNGGCRHGSYTNAEFERVSTGTLAERYRARDRWMIHIAEKGMFIWDGKSLGTKAGYDYALQCGKEAHLIDFSKRGS